MRWYPISVVVLFAAIVNGACEQNLTCFSGLCQPNFDYCSCASGFTGELCNINVTVCDDKFANTDNLASSTVPILSNISAVVNGKLVLRIVIPLVKDRLSTVIFITNASLYPVCAMENWNKSIVECKENYDLNLGWNLAVGCGFTNTTTNGILTYEASIFVQTLDVAAVFRGTPILRETLLPLVFSYSVPVAQEALNNPTEGTPAPSQNSNGVPPPSPNAAPSVSVLFA